MSLNFDICIIGAGCAGTFASLKIANNYKNLKVLMIEAGASPRKRRHQIFGYLGLFPNSSGMLYLNDLSEAQQITSKLKTQKAFSWFQEQTKNILNDKIIEDNLPSNAIQKKIKKNGFSIEKNNLIQIVPAEIHKLSKHISELVDDKRNITSIFNTDVLSLTKDKNMFNIETYDGVFKAKKVLFCVGRGGWRWASEIYKQFDIIENNDYADIGIRIETTTNAMRDFNYSNCTISKDNLSIGPLCWEGTIIPEDHYDMVISSYRGNETRWKSDKVSFNLMGKRLFEGKAVEQLNRLGQLTFILTNDRIAKEKVSVLMSKKSKLDLMPEEYGWLKEAINEVSSFIPDLISKGYMHFPTLMPLAPKIKLDKNLLSEVDGLYVAGESARIPGLLGAIVSGIMAADAICK